MNKTKTPPTLADRLTALRTAKDWTRYRLAQESGVSQVTLGLVEAGRRDPTWSTICKIADALGVSVADLR